MQLPSNIADWPKRERELYEERAAIKEYQGNKPRPMAEREAEVEIRKGIADQAWREAT